MPELKETIARPPRYEHASDEPIDIIRRNECDSQLGSVATGRFQALWNAYADAAEEAERLRQRCDKYENEIAEVCPEDYSLKETFKALQKERAALMQARDWAQAEKHSAQAETERHFNEICTLKLEVEKLRADKEQFRKLLLDQPWHTKAEIILSHMPRYPGPDTRPIVAVRYNSGSEHPPFLRYSNGPKQGFFWDIYGEDFQNEALATIALSQAPAPISVDPIVFTIPLKDDSLQTHGRVPESTAEAKQEASPARKEKAE